MTMKQVGILTEITFQNMKGKDHLENLHLDRIRSTILELHAIRYEVLFWIQFPEDKFDEVLSP